MLNAAATLSVWVALAAFDAPPEDAAAGPAMTLGCFLFGFWAGLGTVGFSKLFSGVSVTRSVTCFASPTVFGATAAAAGSAFATKYVCHGKTGARTWGVAAAQETRGGFDFGSYCRG